MALKRQLVMNFKALHVATMVYHILLLPVDLLLVASHSL
jgi:hypothetical protein